MILPILDVNDVEDSIKFYTQKLGFEKTMAMPGPDGNIVFGFVKFGNFQLGLSAGDAEGVGKGVQFMLYIPDDVKLDDYYATVQKNGAALETEIKTAYWGDRTFSLRDLDGYGLTFTQTVHEADMEHVASVMRGDVQPE